MIKNIDLAAPSTKSNSNNKNSNSAYELITNVEGIANVYVASEGLNYASINVKDEGSRRIKSENYTTNVYDRNNKLIKSFNNRSDDDGFGSPTISNNQLPGKIIVSYQGTYDSPINIVELVIKKGGYYTLNIR